VQVRTHTPGISLPSCPLIDTYHIVVVRVVACYCSGCCLLLFGLLLVVVRVVVVISVSSEEEQLATEISDLRSRSTTHADESIRKAAAAAVAKSDAPISRVNKPAKIKISVAFKLDFVKCSNLPSGEGRFDRCRSPDHTLTC
jgi:hypothetical protein